MQSDVSYDSLLHDRIQRELITTPTKKKILGLLIYYFVI